MERSKRSHYEILGVPRTADRKTIRKAFLARAWELHPDVSADPQAAQKFCEVAAAYEVLSAPAKRLYEGYARHRSDGGRRRPAPRISSFLRTEVTVGHIEAARGAVVHVKLPVFEACTSCRGGDLAAPRRCPTCRGRGRVVVEHVQRVRVPPGSVDGQRILLSGIESGVDEARVGAYLVLRVLPPPDSRFVRYVSMAGLAVTLAVWAFMLVNS